MGLAFRAVCCVAVMGWVSICEADPPAKAQKPPNTVRATAIVDFDFEEPKGNATDAAEFGQTADVGTLTNNALRVDSPFWNQSGKKAILLNATRQQHVNIPDGPDTDRPNAVTASFFFLSLHPLTDGNFHGVIAKRADAKGKSVTNFGINYRPSADAFQLYLNDGSGYRTVVYSVKQAVGSRRLVHLSAIWEVGDAPGTDADKDHDDVRVQLFVNGEPLAPKSVPNGQLIKTEGWIQNLNIKGLLNNVPLTIGSSELAAEFTSGLFDEFLLFDRALTSEEAAKLFLEVAGPNAKTLAKQEAAPVASAAAVPTITATSVHGLQAGTTTRITVSGTNLAPDPRLIVPDVMLEQKLLPGANANRFTVDVTVPGHVPLSWMPIFVETANGVSSPFPIAIDTLPQLDANATTLEKPATLPAAFSGQITGSNIVKIYFQGKQGDRVAAEVEAKRLGSSFDPVVEIKTEKGTPLKIGWGQTLLRGDAGIEVKLPADGVYFVEVHDLTYKAAGQNRFRVKIGDFASIVQWSPVKHGKEALRGLNAVTLGDSEVDSFSSTLPLGVEETGKSPIWASGQKHTGPAPGLPLTQDFGVWEWFWKDKNKAVPATFKDSPHVPVGLEGTIENPGEEDVWVLDVMPGQKLRFTLECGSLPSLLDGLLTIRSHPQGKVLVYKEDSGTNRDLQTDYAVPANVKQIQVGVKDLQERGGKHFSYYVKIAPVNAPDFSLSINAESLTLPEDGTAVLQLSLTRKNYIGPIQLRVAGDDAVSIIPATIPKDTGNQTFFVTLSHKADKTVNGFRGLTLIAESVGLDEELIRTATITPAAGVHTLPGFESLLSTTITSKASLEVLTENLPKALFKGVPANVDIQVKHQTEAGSTPAVRLSLLTTEPVRKVDPKDPKKGNKPKIRSQAGQAIAGGKTTGRLRIAVPVDVAVKEIDAVIKAELVPHAYSGKVTGTVYSFPFKLPVQTAAVVKVDPKTLSLKSTKPHTVKGTIQRAKGFEESLTITLNGLPKGYQTTEATVPAKSTSFEIPIMPTKEKAAKTIKANLSIHTGKGNPILPNMPVELKIAP